MRQAGGGVTAERMSRQTVTPSPSGSRTSRIATSGRRAGMRAMRLGRRAGLADDLDVVLRLEQLGDAATDDLVVVEQEHGDGHGVALLGPIFSRPTPEATRSTDADDLGTGPDGEGRKSRDLTALRIWRARSAAGTRRPSPQSPRSRDHRPHGHGPLAGSDRRLHRRQWRHTHGGRHDRIGHTSTPSRRSSAGRSETGGRTRPQRTSTCTAGGGSPR